VIRSIHEHAPHIRDLADRLDLVALRIDLDLTRFQRAGEGAGQSPTGGGHDVIERRRMRRVLLGPDAIVLGDLGVHPECHRLGFGWQIRQPLRTSQPLDPHTRDIGRGHGTFAYPTPAAGNAA
jgi:hypothetical protein